MPLISLFLIAVLVAAFFTPAHFTFDLKTHEEAHCEEFGISKDKWVYEYREDSVMVCSKAIGGLAEGCAISDGQTCRIVLPK